VSVIVELFVVVREEDVDLNLIAAPCASVSSEALLAAAEKPGFLPSPHTPLPPIPPFAFLIGPATQNFLEDTGDTIRVDGEAEGGLSA